MGIHAADNLSHLAHQVEEPTVPGHYDYDEYAIYEDNKIIERYHGGHAAWEQARIRFLHLFNVEKRAVKLIGRVFN